MPLRKPAFALFDLDGTLVDTAPDLAWAVDAMLHALDMPARGETKVRSWIGNGVERLVKRALTDDFSAEPAQELYERGFPLFMQLYADNACVKSQIYPGVLEAITYLKQIDCKLACVTNKRDLFTRKVLETLELHKEFEITISGDTLAKKKPDPLPLLHCAEFFGLRPEDGLMIGDSSTDINAAKNAGLQMLYVTYGYNQGRNIEHLPINEIVDSLSELPTLLPR